jgi:hypothetical protein
MAAAVAAAREGAAVSLVEAQPCLGGTVAHALIHTIGGVYDTAGEYVNGGLVKELAETLIRTDPNVRQRRIGRTCVLSVDPEAYQAISQRLVMAESRIFVHTAARVQSVRLQGNRIVALEVVDSFGTTWHHPKAVIDATGNAEITRLVNPNLIQDERGRAAGGLIFRMRGVAPEALTWPKSTGIVRALREAVDSGSLPPSCANVWIDVGVRQGEAFVKTPISIPSDWHSSAVRRSTERHAHDLQVAILSFLKSLPGFRNSELCRTGIVGVRDGGRVWGEYCLTSDDVRQGRRFDDVACRGVWPIEFWDPDRGVRMEYLPEGSTYDIPLRSLKVRGIENLWVAGKCLSADRLAQASARIAGCCWSRGEAAGRAAAS